MGFDLDPASLAESIEKFPKTRVLVIGDIIMDEYIWGEVSRISPEAPVPVVDVKRETKMLGGADRRGADAAARMAAETVREP
jgi:bifunctional ADP-heptose synthase (sugar kinase/adenylyltransferase)